MAALHATAKLRNVERTILKRMMTGSIGTTIVPVGDSRFDSTTVDSFVRLSVHPTAETFSGTIGGYRSTRARVLVTAECYTRDSTKKGVATLDSVVDLAEQVAHRLRLADLPLVDFISDPSGNTLVSGATIRFISPPFIQFLDPDSGWDRRIVTAEGTYFIRHAE